MRIGIITIQKCDNFGADLQAYALGAKLRNMGYEAENIDYLFYKHPRHIKGKYENPVLPISIVNRVKEMLYPVVSRLRVNGHRRRMLTSRRERFEAWQRYIKSGKEYRSVDELYENPPLYDVYMVGSDQVWNPRMYSNIGPYFLDFVPDGARCVSYAASFGVSQLSGKVFLKYKNWLRRFSFIGLRETKGVEFVRAMALNATIQHVVDPTILLSSAEWSCVSNPPKDLPGTPYLLLYDLVNCGDTVDTAKKISKDRGLEIVNLGHGAYGPGEFLWLFAHADIVVTNSFHGTVFSLLNHRPFVTVIPRKMVNGERIQSLLSSVGLGYDNSQIEDWSDVDCRLEIEKRRSSEFLINALIGAGNGSVVRPVLPIGCYAYMVLDKNIRRESTSGGAFTALATEVINKGGVVFGAAFNTEFTQVRHISVETVEELFLLRKSKYVWSEPRQAYLQVQEKISEGRLVLFSGTPCQCAAVRKIVGDSENLITVDFVCHGTPQMEYFRSYISELKSTYGSRVVSYEFRNKDKGWNFPHIVARFENGEIYDRILMNDVYYIGFAKNFTLRQACFKCPFVGIERESDITIGDCWRIGATIPDMDDNQGTSMVLVNTERGQRLFEHACQCHGAGRISVYDLDMAQACNMPLMQRPLKPNLYEAFNASFSGTGSYGASSKLFVSRKELRIARVKYLVKKWSWFFWKGRQ